MSDQPNQKSKWEEWQLSALVLGELDAATAKKLKAAASKDPALYAEIRALKRTMSQVQSVYKSEHGVGRGELERNQRLERIFSAAAEQRATNTVATDLVEPAKNEEPSFAERNARMTWIGLSAMAACLFIAVRRCWKMLN